MHACMPFFLLKCLNSHTYQFTIKANCTSTLPEHGRGLLGPFVVDKLVELLPHEHWV